MIEKDFIKPVVGELNKYKLLKERITEFYVFAKLSDDIVLIEIESIKSRCLVIYGSEYDILTTCVDLNEHD